MITLIQMNAVKKILLFRCKVFATQTPITPTGDKRRFMKIKMQKTYCLYPSSCNMQTAFQHSEFHDTTQQGCLNFLPANLALDPSSSSMRRIWLYLAKRSERQGAPVLIWPVHRPTTRSAMKQSSVSPDLKRGGKVIRSCVNYASPHQYLKCPESAFIIIFISLTLTFQLIYFLFIKKWVLTYGKPQCPSHSSQPEGEHQWTLSHCQSG